MAKCQNCGLDNLPDGVFCTFCGQQLSGFRDSNSVQQSTSGVKLQNHSASQQPTQSQPPYENQPPYKWQQPHGGQCPYGRQDPIDPPKSHTVAMILCFLFGGLGIHRFYMGKIGTGILMLLTLGGFGIWSIIDFLILAFDNFNDSNGQLLAGKNRKVVIVIMVFYGIFIIFFIIGILIGLATPQNSIYNYVTRGKAARDYATQSAYHAIALSEEAYFAAHNRYTANYNDLVSEIGLIIDNNLRYSKIKLYKMSSTPCYQFRISHSDLNSTIYNYDSCSRDTVTIINR
jgi:TM2 domain-containing membrane protein YozV